MMKKKSNFFNRNFIESLNYIKESRVYIYFIILIFITALAVGLFFNPPSSMAEFLRELMKSLVDKTSGLNTGQLIIYIFWNNSLASFFGIIFGVIFGIFPLIATLFNGYLVGYVSKIAISNLGVSSLWRLVPHGIFELPALIISFAMGLKIGMTLFKKNSTKEFFRRFILSLKVFFFVVLPLLIIAAIIEGILIGFAG